MYSSQNKLDEAIRCIKETLRINKLCLGDSHSEVANNLTMLAKLLTRQGEHLEAEKYLRHAVQITRALDGPKSPGLANVLRAFAKVLSEIGKTEESKACINESLQILQKGDPLLVENGTEEEKADQGVADSLIQLAMLEKSQRNYEKALKLFQDVLEIQNIIDQLDLPGLAATHFSIGEILRHLGRFEESLASFKQALEIRRRVLSKEDRLLPHTMNSIAIVLADLVSVSVKRLVLYDHL